MTRMIGRAPALLLGALQLSILILLDLPIQATGFPMMCPSRQAPYASPLIGRARAAACLPQRRDVGKAPRSAARDVRVMKMASVPTFEDWDYKAHWYPVSWAEDLPVSEPTKVTVFDEDYVVTRIPASGAQGTDEEYEVLAMEDRCPHKSAALSEGRVTSKGHFLCAYHGWTFDGKNGTCLQIPQADGFRTRPGADRKKREDGRAVPAMISQGMVWLFPFGGMERALSAPPPPRVPELDEEGWKATTVVRDFPVDWPILIENILDPDHGLFAHQNTGFDLYSASADVPQDVREESVGGGWVLNGEVDAKEKLMALSKARLAEGGGGGGGKDGSGARLLARAVRGGGETGVGQDGATEEAPLRSTSTYMAPSLIYQCRRNPAKGNSTAFLTAFWVCPVGTGRSRFMSAAVAKVPFRIPRWLLHVNLNNFLDQDTFLLATTQKHLLAAEAAAYEEGVAEGGGVGVRKKVYVYRSPTEPLGVRLGAFFDATLARAPNRRDVLLGMGGSKGILLAPTPTRESVLDRYEQHTKICPNSASLVRKCYSAKVAAMVGALFLLIAKGACIAAVVSAAGSTPPMWISKLNAVLSPALMRVAVVLCGAVWYFARKMHREFFFKYTADYRVRDMKKLPKVWLDH